MIFCISTWCHCGMQDVPIAILTLKSPLIHRTRLISFLYKWNDFRNGWNTSHILLIRSNSKQVNNTNICLFHPMTWNIWGTFSYRILQTLNTKLIVGQCNADKKPTVLEIKDIFLAKWGSKSLYIKEELISAEGELLAVGDVS